MKWKEVRGDESVVGSDDTKKVKMVLFSYRQRICGAINYELINFRFFSAPTF